MAEKYKIWDKKEDLVTPGMDRNGKQRWKAKEYMDSHAQWADSPDVKVVISKGRINCAFFYEFDAFKKSFYDIGADIGDDMTDEEILDAVEAFEALPPDDPPPDAMERVAAALEFQNLMSL